MKIDATAGGVNFLKASDLTGETPATIEKVEEKVIHNPFVGAAEPQVVTYFTLRGQPGQQWSLICNKTIQRQIIGIIGSNETDDWIGRKVILFPTTASNGKPCVRVKT